MSTNGGADPLRELVRLGQSPWLDYIDRELIESGELARLVASGAVRGMTSNPAIFEQAMAHGRSYESAMLALARAGHDALRIYETLAMADVRAAADVFRRVYEESDGNDGFVSFEVSPHLVDDAAGTVAAAQRIWAALARPNVMIKVPATDAGLDATRQLLAGGINVNVTLLFSVERYRNVLRAYASGLEAALAGGRRIERIASVASFFLSRIDTAVDAQLERRAAANGREAEALLALRGEAAVASARCAYAAFEEFCTAGPFRQLAARGARRQRLLWASTGTKNPVYSDVKYVEPLVGAHTVNTMPRATLEAYRDHGRPALRLPADVSLGNATLAALAAAGIDVADVTARLLEEGIAKFVAPYDSLLRAIAQRVGQAPG
ncbi:MAG TPA: transaldolase [Gammaproteobacteria bacterium]|jgi:transaldolase|nr:transaldolase [Gammaproteobacteria bacterium]